MNRTVRQQRPCMGGLPQLLVYCLTSFTPLGAQSVTTGQPHKFVIPASVQIDGTISVNDHTYAPPNAPSGVHVVALHRGDLTLAGDNTFYNAGDFNSYIDSILNGDLIVLAASVNKNDGMALSQISARLEKLGATNEFEGQSNTNGTLAFIGHDNLHMGQAYHSGGPISGYFAQDVLKNYTFTELDYLTYSLDPANYTIKVGNQTWNGEKICTSTYGFFLVEVDRTNPEVAINFKCYSDWGGPPNPYLDNLASDLAAMSLSENVGIFLITLGPPWINPDDSELWRAKAPIVAAQLRPFGGYPGTFTNLTASDTYALVGFPATPSGIPGSHGRASEASTNYPGHPSGILKGALRRGRRYSFYSSMIGDLTGMDSMGLYAIIGQAAQPYPSLANQDQVNAFQYVTKQMCHNLGVTNCDNYNPRDAYPDTSVSASALQSALNNVPPQVDCTKDMNKSQAFCVVTAQLSEELQYLKSIRNYGNNLNSFLSDKLTEDSLELQNVFNNLQSTIGPQPGSPAVSIIESLVSSALSIASALPFGEGLSAVGPGFATLGAYFGFGTGLANDLNGNSKTFDYTTAVENLEQDTVNSFNNKLTVLGTLFNFIYQDWGRLKALGMARNSAQPGTQWYWDTTVTTGQLLAGMKLGTERALYESMMAARYQIGYFEAPNIGAYYVMNADFYDCERGGLHDPFYLYTVNLPYANIMETPGYAPGVTAWVAIGDHEDAWWYCNYTAPGPDVLTHILSAPKLDGNGANTGGLGVHPPAFFEGGSPFTQITCTLGYGCPWGSGAPAAPLRPPVAGPPPVASLTVTVLSHVRNGNQMQVHLLLLNNGNTALQNVTVTKIGLQVLAGSGQASLATPTPISAGNLAAGAGATIELNLNVPTTVTKLSLTESGTVQSGAGVSQFSQSQVLFP